MKCTLGGATERAAPATCRRSVVALVLKKCLYATIALLTVSGIVGCRDRALQGQLATLKARVDTLTAVVRAINSGAGQRPTRPDTATVSIGAGRGIGRPDAPVVIVEFTDFQCPWCGEHYRKTLPHLLHDYVEKGVVRYIVRDLPLPMHPKARAAATAAMCVGTLNPGSFWQIHNALFEAQARLSDSMIERVVASTNISLSRFTRCVTSATTTKALDAEIKEALAVGIRSTPGFVIGPNTHTGVVSGKSFQGAYPLEAFRTAIAGALSDSMQGRTTASGLITQ